MSLYHRNVFESHKSPAEAIRSLYFNAYNHLIHILSTHCSAIKSVAVRAVRMKQVLATEDELAQSRDLKLESYVVHQSSFSHSHQDGISS